MTAVQLPEVPSGVPYVEVGRSDGTHMEFPSCDYYTAAQLREYATEAVRQHCERVARKIRARADDPGTAQHHGNQYVYGLRNAANTVDSLTPPEPNSDR